MGYIKSPLNYTGGKFKLLPKLLPLMPGGIDTFVDMFCGGCNVAVNVEANKKICNDIESHVIGFYEGIQGLTGEDAREKILEIVSTYNLNKENQEGFLNCREDYNKSKSWDMFYAVISHAFNNQIRYNKSGEYNMPFGKNRSSFNPSLQKRFIEFVDSLDDKFIFSNKDFRELNLSELKEDDFVYVDPPYLITTAVYNENGGWTEKDEQELYEVLDNLHNQGIKFMLSNVLENKGKSNDILKEWSEKYTVHYLDHTYSNCSYQAKDRESKTIEVAITNY